MIRLPIWCAFSASFIVFMSTPVCAGSLSPIAPAASSVPNFFGTVALPIAKTPFDAKWRHAGFGDRGPSTRTERPRLRDFATVQQDINRRLSYRAILPTWGVATLGPGRVTHLRADRVIAKIMQS